MSNAVNGKVCADISALVAASKNSECVDIGAAGSLLSTGCSSSGCGSAVLPPDFVAGAKVWSWRTHALRRSV